MSLAIGWLSLAAALAYLALAGLVGMELLRFGSRRGFSQFGTAFVLMAGAIGVHHGLEGFKAFGDAGARPSLVVDALVIGLLPAAVFVALRAELAVGGRGDRFLAGTPWWLRAVPWAGTFAGGVLAAAVVDHVGRHGMALWKTWPSIVLTIAYAAAGLLFVRAQTARREATGGFSVSGLALAAMFPTCAVMQATTAATGGVDVTLFLVDVATVPASAWFLLSTLRLHRSVLRDWNRRPLVGRPRPTKRPSPWATRA
jgi:hypothetical protein